MTKRTLKHLGLCLALVLLCAALFGVPALAESGELTGLGIHVDSTVDSELDVNFNIDPAGVNGDEQPEVSYQLYIDDLADPERNPVLVVDDMDEGWFVAPAGMLPAGRPYLATVKATAEGYDPAYAEAEFVTRVEDDNFDIYLQVNENDYETTLPTSKDTRISISAPGAEEVWFGTGDRWEIRLNDWGDWDERWSRDPGNIRFQWSWEGKETRTVYARARFVDPVTGEDVWVMSNAVRVTTEGVSASKPLIQFSSKAVKRGELLSFYAHEDYIPNGGDDLRLAVYVLKQSGDDETVLFDGEFRDPGQYTEDNPIKIPTANMPKGNYVLRTYWRGIGIDGPAREDEITINAPAKDAVMFSVNKTTVVPQESYYIAAYVPKAAGLCVYEDDEIRETFEGQDSFFWSDAYDELAVRTYTLGKWNATKGEWEKTASKVTVTVASNEELPAPGIIVAPDDQEPFENCDGVIEEGRGLTISVAPSSDAPASTRYDLLVDDETDGYTLRDEVFDWEWADGHSEICRIEGEELQLGHIYSVRVFSSGYGCPAREDGIHFVVVRGDTRGIELEIVPPDDGSLDSIIPNEMLGINVNAPGATALQVLWDGEWQNTDLDWRNEEEDTWSWEWSLNNLGPQNIIVRACYDDIDYSDFNWDDLNWDAYSEPLSVNVLDGDEATVPNVTLNKTSLTRGDLLTVNVAGVTENPESVSRYMLHIFGMNEDGELWRHIDQLWDEREPERDSDDEGEEILAPTSFTVPTICLEPGEYRVQLDAIAAAGYINADTGYEGLRFTVTDFADEADARLTVTSATGTAVAYNSATDTYSLPVHNEFVISGYLAGAEDLCLFVDDRFEDEWHGADSFSWTYNTGMKETHVYALGCWDEGTQNWAKVEDVALTLNITATGTALNAPVIDGARVASEGEDYTFYVSSLGNYNNRQPGWYSIRVYDQESGEPVLEEDLDWDDERIGASGTEDAGFTLSAEELATGASYVIEACAFAENRPGARTELRFTVVPEADDSFTLSLSEPEEGQDSYLVRQGIDITIGLNEEEAHSATAVQLFWDYGWQDVDDGSYDDEEQAFKFNWDKDFAGTQDAVARYTTDEDPSGEDVNWIYSNTVPMTVGQLGEIRVPAVTLEKNVLNRGETLNVAIASLSAADKKLVDGYFVQIFDAEGPDVWEPRFELDYPADATSFTLPTLGLWEGRYRLRVSVNAEPGYMTYATDDDDRSLWFTVTDEGGEAQLYLTGMDGTRLEPGEDGYVNIDTRENVIVNAYIPDASGVAAMEGDDVLCANGGNGAMEMTSWNSSGERTLVLHQWDEFNETWNPWPDAEEPVELKVRVNAPNGALTTPKVDAHVIELDQEDDYVFGVKCDPRAEYIYARIWHEPDGNGIWMENLDWEPDDEGWMYFGVGKSDFEEDESYIVSVSAIASGYDEADTEARIYAVPKISKRTVTLTVNNEEDTTTFRSHANVPVSISSAVEPEEVEILWDFWQPLNMFLGADGFDYSVLTDDEGYTFHCSTGSGVKSALVRIRSGNNWYYSNGVTMNVTAEGQLDAPDISQEIRDDGKLYVTFNGAVENADAYFLQITNDNGFYRDYTDRIQDVPGEASAIDLDETEEDEEGNAHRVFYPGRYRVVAGAEPDGAALPGYDGGWTDGEDEDLWFELPNVLQVRTRDERYEDPETGDWVDGEWSDLTSEDVTVDVHQEYAIHAEVSTDRKWCFFNGNDTEDEIIDRDEDDNEIRLSEYDIYRATGDPGEYTYYLGWFDEENDRWVREDDLSVKVTVEANGEVGDPRIECGATLTLPDAEDTEGRGILIGDVDGMAKGDLSFDIYAAQDAEWYHLQIVDTEFWDALPIDPEDIDDDGSDRDVNFEIEGQLTSVAVPYGLFTPGHQYIIRVGAHASGRSSGHAEARFMAMKPSADGNAHVTLIVNGLNDGLTSIYSGQDIDLRLVAVMEQNVPDDGEGHVEYIEANQVQLFFDGEWHDVNEDFLRDVLEDYDEENCSLAQGVEFRMSFGSGTQNLMARATWSDLDALEEGEEPEWVYSLVTRLDILSKGELRLPKVSIENLENGRISVGTPLILDLDVTGLEDSVNPDEAEPYYRVRLLGAEREENWRDEYYSADYAYGVEQISVATAALEPGRDYMVEIGLVTDVPGYDHDWTGGENDSALRFRAMPPRDITLTTDLPMDGQGWYQAAACVDFSVSATVPGAEEIRLLVNGEERERRNGSILMWQHSWDKAGSYAYELECNYGGGWETPLDGDGNPYGMNVAVSAEDKLNAPVIVVPASIEEGGILKINITEVDPNAEHVNVEVWRDGEEEPFFRENDYDISEPLTIEDRDFWADETYTVNVYTWTPGYEAAWAEKQIIVLPPANDDEQAKIRLFVNESETAASVRANQRYTIRYSLNVDPDFIDWMWDGEWQNIDRHGGESDPAASGSFTRSDGTGTRTLILRAGVVDVDEEGNRDDSTFRYIYSNPVVLTVEGIDIPRPTIDAILGRNDDEECTLTRGTPLTVRFSFDESWEDCVESFDVSLINVNEHNEPEESAVTVNVPDDQREAVLPTLSLRPGAAYVVEVWAKGNVGYNSNGNDLGEDKAERIPVVEMPEEDMRPGIEANVTEARTRQDYTVTASFPGQTVGILRGSETEPRGDGWVGDEAVTITDHSDEAGVITYTLAIRNAKGNWRRLEQQCAVTVTAEDDLDAPQIDVAGTIAPGEDGYENVVIQVRQVENATWYDFNVWCVDNDRELARGEFGPEGFNYGPYAIVVDGNSLNPGWRYEVNVSAHAPGYNSSESRKTFVAVPPVSDDIEAPSIALEAVLGEGVNLNSVPVSQDVAFRFTTENIDKPFVQAFWGDQWEDIWPEDDIPGNYGDNTFDFAPYRAGDWNLMVRAVDLGSEIPEDDDEARDWLHGWRDNVDMNSLDWTYSAPVEMSSIQAGAIPEVTAVISPTKLSRGSRLNVKIAIGDEGEGARDGIDHIEVTIFGQNEDSDDFWNEISRLRLLPDEKTVDLPTDAMDPGRYRVQVRANGRPGYQSNETDNNDPSLFFTLGDNFRATLNVSKTEGVKVFENLSISARVPGASRVELYANGDFCGDNGGEGENLSFDNFNVDRAEEYTFTLKAWGWDEEAEEEFELDFSYTPVTVKATGVDMVAPVVDMPVVVTEGNDFTFTVNPAEHAERYDIRVVEQNGSDGDERPELLHADDAGTYTVDFDDLEPGNTYAVTVWAAGLGYNAVYNEYEFVVVANVEGSLTLSVESVIAEGSKYTVPSHADYTVMAVADSSIANSIHHIEIRWDGDMHDDLFEQDENDNTVWSFTRSDNAQQRSVYAVAYDENDNVLATSNGITIVVKSDNGQVGKPKVAITSGIRDKNGQIRVNADQGGVTVKVEPMTGVDHFDVYVRGTDNSNGGDFWYDYAENHELEDGDGGTVILRIDEPDLNKSYRVYVYAVGAEGWTDNETGSFDSSLRFRFQTKSIADMQVLTLPAAITEIEAEAFRGNFSLEIVDLRNVRSIGNYAFADCGSLVYVILPDNGVTFGNNCFPYGVTFVCGDGATANWADENGYNHISTLPND